MLGAPIGSAYVEIRPDTAGFEQQLATQIPAATQRAGRGAIINIPPADTTGFEAGAEQAAHLFAERFTRVLEYTGLYFGFSKIKDEIIGGVDEAAKEAQQQQHAVFLYGPQNQANIDQFTAHAVDALGKTKGAALETANAFGEIFRGAGESQQQALQDAEEFTRKLAGLSSRTGVDQDQLASDLYSALQGGRALALRRYGIDIDEQKLPQLAVQYGIVQPQGPDPIALKTAQDRLQALQDEKAALQGGPTDPYQQERLQTAVLRVHQAENARGEDNLRYGQVRLSTEIAYRNAVEALQRLQGDTGKIDEAQRRDRLNSLDDEIAKQREEIATLSAGTIPDLTPEQKTLTIKAIIQNDPDYANLPDKLGKGPSDTFQKARSSASEFKNELGKGLLPEAERFSDWVTAHGPEIEDLGRDAGHFLSEAADFAGKVVGVLADHATLIERTAGTIAGMWLLNKAATPLVWASEGVRALSSIKTAADGLNLGERIFSKIFPNIPKILDNLGIGGGGAKGLPDVIKPAYTVGEMTVASMVVESMLGGGGAGGRLPYPMGTKPGDPPLPGEAEGAAAGAGSAGALAKLGKGTARVGIAGAIGFGVGEATGSPEAGIGAAGIAAGIPGAVVAGGALLGETIATHVFGAPGFSEAFDKAVRGQMSVSGNLAEEAALHAKRDADLLGPQAAEAMLMAMRDKLMQTSSADDLGKLAEFARQQGWTTVAEALHEDAIAIYQSTHDFQAAGLSLAQTIDYIAQQAGLADQFLHNETTGTRGAQLDAGVGTVIVPSAGPPSRSFDVGGSVDYTGPAVVHAGEYVETPQERRQLMEELRQRRTYADVPTFAQRLPSAGSDDDTAAVLRDVLAELRAIRAMQNSGVGQTSRPLEQHFHGFGEDKVAEIAGREAARALRTYDENRATGRPALSGLRAY
jgi:hypothetical protein